MLAFYIAMAVLAALLLLYLIATSDKSTNIYFVLCFIFVLFSNFGYVYLALSRTLGEAIIANKMTYAGGCFYSLMIFLLVAEVCNVQVPKVYKVLFYFYSFFTYGLVCTIGYNDLYYSSCWIKHFQGVTVLYRTYGPLHSFYTFQLLGYSIGGIALIVLALLRKTRVNRVPVIIITGISVIDIFIYFIEHIIGFSFDIMPLTYIFSEIIMLILENQLCMGNVESAVSKSLSEQTTFGYIVLNRKRNYLGCNSIARHQFPILENTAIGDKLNPEVDAFDAINKSLVNNNKSEYDFGHNGIYGYFNFYIKRLYFRRKFGGYVIQVTDDSERQIYTNLLENYNKELQTSVESSLNKLKKIQEKIITSLADVIENRDNNTGGHVKRTSDIIRIIIQAIKDLGVYRQSDDFYDSVIKASPMHDLGKIAIEDRILRKPGKFSPEEFNIMKSHAEKSAQIVDIILKGVVDEKFCTIARNIAGYHHEKWNGEGYPKGLKGEEIPIEARIMALADVYDALVSARCYKEPISYEKAYYIIMDSMGTHFDPSLKAVFEKCHTKLESYYALFGQ